MLWHLLLLRSSLNIKDRVHNMLNLSIYSHDYNMNYLKEVSSLGVENVFISLHIPEFINDKAKVEKFLTDISTFSFNITADVSKVTFGVFNKAELKSFGITKLRIDYGFSDIEIINLAKEFTIVLNASTLTKEQLDYLNDNLDLSKIEAMHNFYPKVETGLSTKQLVAKNKLLKEYNLLTSGFIHGDQKPRGPIYKGLVTVEEHRYYKPHIAYLLLKELIDEVYVGDIEISNEELSKIMEINQGIIPIEINTNDSYLLSIVNKPLTIRYDSNDINLRIYESRTDYKITDQVEVNTPTTRSRGDITIDNILNNRYMGEIMICLKEMPINEALNTVGYIVEPQILDIDLCGKTISLYE